MAAPTMTTIGKGGTSANATTLVLTLSVGAAVGNSIVVFIRSGTAVSSVTDSKGNTYTVTTIAALATFVATANCTVALAAADTITVTLTSGTCAAVAVKMTGQPYSANGFGNASGIVASNSGGQSATSSSATLTSGQVPVIPADMLAIFIVTITTAAVAGDFSSVNSSYTIFDTAFTTGAGTQRAIAVCTKSLSNANPMASQNPTMTLAGSRTWTSYFTWAAGLTDRGSTANGIQFVGPASVGVRAALGAPATFGQIKKINNLSLVQSRDGLI